VGDEDEGAAAEAAARHGVQGVFGDGLRRTLLLALVVDPVEVRRAGGLELHGARQPRLVEPLQRLFVLLGRYGLVGHFLSPARGDEQEDVVRRRPQPLRQGEQLLHLVEVHARDRRVDLELDAGALQGLDARKRPLEGPRHLPERVVPLGIRAV